MKNSKDNKKSTRSNKYDKERKTVKILTFAVVIAALVVILLLIMSLFSGGDKSQESATDSSGMIIKNSNDSTESDVQSSKNSSESSSESESAASESVESESVESESKESESKESESKESESKESESKKAESDAKKEVEPTDKNVKEAYTEDWEPVETEQEGEHKTNFNDGSQDRIEIKKAAAVATGLNESNIIEWWVENSGEGQVVATVSDSAQTKTYRVYLNWVDGQGWQPTKVEQLEENDKQ